MKKMIKRIIILKSVTCDDANQDGAINLTEVMRIFNDANDFITGHVVTYLTGDNKVNLADVLIVFNNATKFANVIRL